MSILFGLNDPPHGTERSYNGLRLAGSVASREDETVRVFLIGDAAACAKVGQKVPQGYYNIGNMVRSVSRRGAWWAFAEPVWTLGVSPTKRMRMAATAAPWTNWLTGRCSLTGFSSSNNTAAVPPTTKNGGDRK